MKPEKVRAEFYCMAKHNVTSLNDHLLQGPDLTNSSFGLLRVRFREEPVVLVAMFSQIPVDPKECDALGSFGGEGQTSKQARQKTEW